MTRLINLTPHEVVLVGENGSMMRIPPSGQVARVAERVEGAEEFLAVAGNTTPSEIQFSLGGVPLRRVSYGEIEGLPPREEGTFFVVSAVVAMAAAKAGREDVLFPHELVRDSQGRIVGARALARY